VSAWVPASKGEILQPKSSIARSLLGLILGAAACSGDPATPSPGSAGSTQAGSPSVAGASGTGGSSGSAGAASAGASGSAGAAGGVPSTGGAAMAGAAGSSAAGTGGTGGTGGAVGLSGTVKIMVLGSSNELGTCWRALLWKGLQSAGIMNFDMVGGVTDGPDCDVPGYDKDLQAQSGIIISNLMASQFAGWFSAHPPEIVLMHFGGADLLANMPIDGVLKGYTLALEQLRLVNPSARLMIAQHTPEGKDSVVELNADIVTWAAMHTTAASPITVIDLYTGLDPVNDFSDGVHLNVSGSQKVADRFFAALKPLFKP